MDRLVQLHSFYSKTYIKESGLTRNSHPYEPSHRQAHLITTLERPTVQILLNRFTYELSSIGLRGLLLVVEMVNNTQS